MKVVATTVGCKEPEDESRNKKRLRAAEQALAKAVNLGADVIVLPGGLFSTHSAQAREAIADSLIGKAKELGIAIVFGVDEKVKTPRNDWEILSKGYLLPYYGYAWSSSKKARYCWQQRSSTSNNQWLVSNALCEEPRTLMIKDETLAVLMCGEIFNQRIRNALAAHDPKPKVVADVAHSGSNPKGGAFRVFQGMKVLAALGLPSICSVHAQREYAVKHCYVPPGKCLSSRIRDDYVDGPPRIEMKLWTL